MSSITNREARLPDEPSWRMLCALMERSGGSPERVATGLWALEQVKKTVGEDWPERWYQRNRELPSILLNASFHAVAYRQLLVLALQLRIHGRAVGFGQVRRDLRGNVESHRLVHAQLQLEVASLASSRSITFRFEVDKPLGRPADVELWPDQSGTVIECFAVYRDEGTKSDAAYDAELGRAMNALCFEHGVNFAGELRQRLTEEETTQMLDELSRLAVAVAADGTARALHLRNADITVLTMDAAAGRTFTGPVSTGKGWPRGGGIVADKARDWRDSAEPVWLRCDLYDGLWAFSEWAQLPLAEKATHMGLLLGDTVCESPPAGVVISSGPAMVLGEVVGESSFNEAGVRGLRRQLGPWVARETIIVPLCSDAADMAEEWVRMYDAEVEWLSKALEDAHLPRLEAIEAMPE